MGYLTGTDVRKMFGVTRVTMWRYVRDGKLVPHKLSDRVYLYDEEQLYRVLGAAMPQGFDTVIYARVNSAAQKEELQAQILRVTEFAGKAGLSVSKTYWDCTKSLDFSRGTRRGLNDLIMDVVKRKIGCVIVESPDRIAQIGHELLKIVLSNYKVKVIYMNQAPVNPRYLEETTKELTGVVKSLKKLMDVKRDYSASDIDFGA